MSPSFVNFLLNPFITMHFLHFELAISMKCIKLVFNVVLLSKLSTIS